jgi:uncharacterized protein (TIGR03437 family)
VKRVSLWTLVALVSSTLLMGQSAPTIQEFGGLSANAHPGAITAGPDGALWFAEVGSIGRITANGIVKEFSLAQPGTGSQAPNEPNAITTGTDGELWFTLGYDDYYMTTAGAITHQGGTINPCYGQMGSIIVGPDGTVWILYDTGIMNIAGTNTNLSGCGTPGNLRIAAGPDGNIWYTKCCAAKIVRVTLPWLPSLLPNLTEFPIPTANAQPLGITAGPDGALWFTEENGRIGRISTSGKITEYPMPHPASTPGEITAGPDGALWFTDARLNQIGRITTAGVISEYPIPTPASHPLYITPGPDGAIWFTEVTADKIGRIVPPSSPPPNTNNYTITTVAGDGSPTYSGDGGPAASAGMSVAGVAVDPLGNLYLTDGLRIRKVDASSHTINTVAGSVGAPLSNPLGVAVDNSGRFYIAESGGHDIDVVDASGFGVLTNQPSSPGGLAVDAAGNLYIADSDHCQILKLPAGSTSVSVVAGSGTCGYSGDGGPATAAALFYPAGVAVDNSGNIFIADTTNNLIRKVTSNTITTVAGSIVNGTTSKYSGDGGPATSAQMNGPTDVAVDSAGNLYIADTGNWVIRKVNTMQIISTIAGGGSILGDGGPATSAQLSFPYGLAVDAAGDVFIGDRGNYRIRKLTPVPVSANPVISSLNPSSATAGGPAFTLTVNGTGFASGAVVVFDNSPAATTFVSATQLTAMVPAYLIATAQTATVQVSNPQGGASNSVNFPVNAAGGTGPTIITASPLPGGTVGSQYSQGLDATGGTTPYPSWQVISGSLPPGISMTILPGVFTALLSGTPTAPGMFTFIVQVTDSTGATGTRQFSLTISGGSTSGPSISANGIVNSASYAGGSVAPGEIVTIYGSGLGPPTVTGFQVDANGNVPTLLAGTQALFDGVAAPIIYTSTTQVSVVVPYEVAGKASTQVQVVYQNQPSNTVAEPVTAVVPGIFTADSSGHGQGAIVNQDGTINSSSNPAPAGSIVFIYGTGEGQTNPAGVDGKPDGSPAPTPVAQPGMTATIGGMNAQVLYAGGVPGLVAGVLQVNAQIPAGTPSGSAPIQLSLGGQSTQAAVTVAIK